MSRDFTIAMGRSRVATLALTAVAVLSLASACTGSAPADAHSPTSAGEVRCPPGAPEPGATAAPDAAESSAADVRHVDSVQRKLLERFNAGDADGVFALFDPRMQQALPLEKTRAFVQGISQARGRLLKATRTGDSGSSTTKGVYRIEAERGAWQLDLHVDPEGRIDGLRLTDPPPPDPPVAQSDIPLRLPFKGSWFVFWGGDRIELNHHINHKSQRRASDLLVVGEDGKSFTGDGTKNSDYRIYGQPVLAVAPGRVVTVIDGIADNEPGKMNAYMALGNAVVIEHAPKLFSMYAHLQSGKLRVKAGQQVKAGQALGLVGNSGNSSEPHLHFQLQDGPRVEDSFGVEAVFSNVSLTRDGQTTTPAEYSFLKGDTVAPK